MANWQDTGQGLMWLDQPLSVVGMRLGTRTSMVFLVDEDAWVVISPGPNWTETAAPGVDLAKVKYLIAPNLYHHLFMRRACKACANAQCWLVPGLGDKRQDLKADGVLADQAPWQSTELSLYPIDGMSGLNEYVFFHGPSKTLIMTDLVFNIHTSDHWWTRLAMRLNGSYAKFGPSKVMKGMVNERALTKASFDNILQLPFTRIIMAHGDVLEAADAPQQLKQAFAWLWD